LNYEKREIHITPNNSLKEPFDYAYTGLGIYFVNGRCVVEDVVEESPGEKAGFKSGDIIIGINSNLSNNITTYKSIMQHAGGKLRFLVSRDGEIILIYMKPSSILR
jgi:C-terminal processing protease CtpA/Prc